ncbi:TetR/AcrR family transcriptional regulator [Amycolatopsis sp. NPDC059657]|uniref:TetR/AcrR family transcriptional regulator n=1 Tax=Amycolatopsis sp. NPDC059657 TaxID=3346899 RepID=UPI00366F7D83
MTATDPARPMRADARRNYDAVMAAAKQAFAEHGPEAPLDDIAKRAGVGAGTLYRHFPTRIALIEAVYRGEITELSERAHELLAELPPFDALVRWTAEHVTYVLSRSGLAASLKASIDANSDTFQLCRTNLYGAAGALVEAAQKSGDIRTDITGVDVLRLAHGVGVAGQHAPPGDAERLMAIVVDGLRVKN